MIDRLKSISPFWYITIAAFLVLIASSLLQLGYFMDGLHYGTIARNMAVGDGHIWSPHYTDTIHPIFAESLSLAMYLESLFFWVLGDHFWVEKLYCIVVGILHLVLIVRIWKLVNQDEAIQKLSWIPALLWTTTAMIFWSFTNNMLENTSSLFALLAVYLTLKGILKQQLKWLAVAGIVTLLCGLSKSVVGLFPLGSYFLYWVLNRQEKIAKAAFQQGIIVIAFVISLALLFLIEPAREFITLHLNGHLSESLEGKTAVSAHRYDIMTRLFYELIPMLALALIFGFIGKGKSTRHIQWKQVYFFILVGLSASVPIMLSPKQSGYYVVPSIPYFALGIALILAPIIQQLIAKRDVHSKGWKTFQWVSITICLAAFVFVFVRPVKYARHQERIVAAETFSPHLPKGTTIGVCPSIRGDYPMHSYMYRVNYVSLDANEGYNYYLSDGTCIPEGYETLKSSGKYILYKKPD